MTFKKLVFLCAYTALLIFSAEYLSYRCLSHEHRKPLLYNTAFSFDMVVGDEGLYRFDPFLGWSFNPEAEEREIPETYRIHEGVIELSSYLPKPQDTLRILITGGSTSDPLLFPSSWTVKLFQKLKESYSVEFYIAAVADHNSGQELLKTLNFLLWQKPDLHLSYCGANENDQALGYTTYYEDLLYRELLSGAPRILPNTIVFGRKLLHLQPDDRFFPISENYNHDRKRFWKSNVTAMRALSVEYDYEFICALQPVLGVGPHNSISRESELISLDGLTEDIIEEMKTEQEFYSFALNEAEKLEYVVDFTNVFGSVKESPFFDNCHIHDEYKTILADSMYSLVSSAFLKKINVIATRDQRIE